MRQTAQCHKCGTPCHLESGTSMLPQGWAYVARYWDGNRSAPHCPQCYQKYIAFVDSNRIRPGVETTLETLRKVLSLGSSRLIQLINSRDAALGILQEATKARERKVSAEDALQLLEKSLQKAQEALSSTKLR